MIQNLPLTSSEDRPHELSAGCWCGPMVESFGDAPTQLVHQPEADQEDRA